MELVWAFLLVAGVTAAAVTALLLVRRRAPEGGFFQDGDRAAGFFGVLATGFAVLLGFIVFLAFESYDQSRQGAETEALLVAQQFETAQFMPANVRAELSGELVCYGRSVVSQEWPRAEAGTQGNQINPWGAELFRTLRTVDPESPAEQAAYAKWLDQTSDREQARSDRIHGAEGVIPSPLWLVLFFSAVAIFLFTMFFADSGERAVVQAVQIGTVVAVITATLLLINFLDNPFHSGLGGVRPVAMERTLGILEQEMKSAGAWVISGRLHQPATATVVRMSAGEVVTTDGPFVESKEHLGGFYIIEAEDLDAALAWASKVSKVIKTPIEVRPFADWKA